MAFAFIPYSSSFSRPLSHADRSHTSQRRINSVMLSDFVPRGSAYEKEKKIHSHSPIGSFLLSQPRILSSSTTHSSRHHSPSCPIFIIRASVMSPGPKTAVYSSYHLLTAFVRLSPLLMTSWEKFTTANRSRIRPCVYLPENQRK